MQTSTASAASAASTAVPGTGEAGSAVAPGAVGGAGDAGTAAAAAAAVADAASPGAVPSDLHPRDHWVYASYKRMPELFAAAPEVFAAFDWARFGVEQDVRESNFWFGSAGASTACHYDR